MIKNAVGYLDECGDLGWKLDKPYQQGGSSQYFVVSLAVGLNSNYRKFDRIIKNLHKNQGWTSKHEKKWATINHKGRVEFFELISKELAINSEIALFAAVFNKRQLPDNLSAYVSDEPPKRGLSHLLYAALMSKMVEKLFEIHNLSSFNYCPDELNEGTRVLDSILEYQLILRNRHATHLKRMDFSKPMQSGLTCADMIAGAVWEAQENQNTVYLDKISGNIHIINLF